MDVRVWFDPPTRRVNVIVAAGESALTIVDGREVWVPVRFGAETPVALSLSERLFAAIVQEGMGVVPASSVIETAWKDTIGTRDRLLDLLERVVVP